MAWAQAPPGGARLVPPRAGTPAPAAPASAGSVIATIGGRSVTREELRAREEQAFAEYRERIGQEVPAQVRPAIRRQLLENLLRRELLVLEAARRGITVSDAEAEEQLKHEPFFNPDGRFDPRRFEVIRTTQPENFRNALAVAKEQLAARRLNERLEREMGPDPRALRLEVQRMLARVTLDHLSLRRAEFSGGFREPRESEVLAAYRAGGDAFRRPAEAVLTVLLVDQPAPPADTPAEGPEADRWREGLRPRADSALAAARGGSSFEDLARVCGSVRREVVVTPDNFPGFWRGGARDAEAVFAARPGGLLATPVPSARGWLVVRVERKTPAGTRPLAEVARQIRATLRAEARLHGEERELRAAFERDKGRFSTTGWKLRYAVFDTASVPVGEPTPAELDRWHRAHMADFSSFDAASGSIRVLPLSEVRGAATAMWKSERRREGARHAANQLTAAWRNRQRDRNLERAASAVREAGPVVPNGVVDSTSEGRALEAELKRAGLSRRTEQLGFRGGWVVYTLHDSIPGFEPPFEQVRFRLAGERAAAERAAEEAGARKLYDENPSAFDLRDVIHFSRIVFETPNPMSVPLTRAEVERYYREHIDRYSAPEIARVRQILIEPAGPGPEADAEARAKAEGLLDRLRAGEDFAELARRYSDDAATAAKGGDLGDFGRGTMLSAFEQVAFGLKPGQLSDVFRTEVGYHIAQGISYEPFSAHDLRYIYASVGWDAALEMADTLMNRRCDSLVASVKTAAGGRAAAAKLGLHPQSMFHVVGTRQAIPELNTFYMQLERTRPGQMVPVRGFDRGAGHFVAWVDSVGTARPQDWPEAREAAIDAYRRGAAQRAVNAKRAELDSMLASGWSLDSLAALMGGWERIPDAAPGVGLPGLGGSEVTDSLVFGTARTGPALAEGRTSGWLDLPGGIAKLRVVKRTEAEASQVASHFENESRIRLEHQLADYFEGLKKRYPVRIRDERLRDTPLPPPPVSRLK